MSKHINIIVLGTGNVGYELINTVYNHYSSQLRIVLISDSQHHIFSDSEFSKDELESFISKRHTNSISNSHISESIDRITTLNQNETVIIDASDSEKTSDILLKCKKAGTKVVLANKKPLVQSLSSFREITANKIGASATVGTRLPIIKTVIKEKLSINNIKSFDGCFSGSIGFIIKQIESGLTFSEAVKIAHKNGYTEPDPRDDLSGIDIARKTLIVSRFLGAEIEFKDVKIESLFPEEFNEISVEEFLKTIESENIKYQLLFEKAKSENKKVRYTGSYCKGICSVKLQLIDSESDLGKIQGSEKILVFTDIEQKAKVVKAIEPGAGAKSTVKDIITDIFDIFNPE